MRVSYTKSQYTTVEICRKVQESDNIKKSIWQKVVRQQVLLSLRTGSSSRSRRKGYQYTAWISFFEEIKVMHGRHFTTNKNSMLFDNEAETYGMDMVCQFHCILEFNILKISSNNGD